MQLNKIYLFLVFLSIISCNGEKINGKIIYSMVLNQTIKPLPPLPPPNIYKNEVISKKILDSLNKVPLNIAVYPFKLIIKNFNQDFSKENLKNLQIEGSIIPINNNIDARRSINFNLIKKNSIKQLNTIIKKNDGLLYISDIKFNNKHNKAIVVIGYSQGKLSGGLVLYYIEKKNNQWKIISKNTKSIS